MAHDSETFTAHRRRIDGDQRGSEKVKRVLLGVMLSIFVTVPCFAATAHEQAISYILADQDKPTEPGDKYYTSESEPNPILMETTAYCSGTKGSHGDVMREGYCAAAPELYGDVLIIYEAILQDDGTYKVGDYLDTLLVKDTGYGYPTYEGKSKIRPDKNASGKGIGTIESPKILHCDVRKDNIKRCKEWMERTNGKIFAIIVEGKG